MTITTNDTSPKVVSKKAAGADLVKHKPVFSHDSKYLFVCCEENVRVYSTTSAELVRELRAHKHEVICVFLNPKNQLQLITCSSEELIFWDYLDGICHQVIDTAKSITKILWPSSQSSIFVLTDKTDLFEAAYLKQHVSDWVLIQRRFADNMIDGLSGTYLAAFKKNELFVYLTGSKQMLNKKLSVHQRFTCIATHPSEYCFATGDYEGRIYVWYNFLKGDFVRSVLHWHQLPLADLTFTAAGSSIVSGGGECVLVKWKIDTDNKRFVPRLGMPMVYVTASPNNTVTATSHVDNAIRLLNSQGKVLSTIQGMTKGHLWKEFGWDSVPTGLLYDPQNKALVLNGKPGHLQFFLHSQDKQLFNLDITKRNFHHSEKEYKVFPIEVEKAAFSFDGKWLATVERRTDGTVVSDFRLKFWSYSLEFSNYVLNTNVEFPHTGKIDGLKFQPRVADDDELSALVVTSSPEDKRFKFWKLCDDSDIYKKKVGWNCESVGYFRDMPCTSVAFSADGSVLAVACNHIVTLWAAINCQMNAMLCHPRIADEIKEIEFGSDNCAHLIVCASKSYINVWDVISLRVKWSVKLDVACLTKDIGSSLMAVFSKDGDLVVFEPSSPTPVVKQRKISSKNVIHAAFLPATDRADESNEKLLPWQRHSTLCFLNEDQLLLEVADLSEVERQRTTTLSVQLQSNVPLTPFGMLIARQTKSDVKEREVQQRKPRATSEVLREMFTSPSNTLPPVSILFELHLSCCVRKESQKNVNEEEHASGDDVEADRDDESSMEVDSDSDEDDDVRLKERKQIEATQVSSSEGTIPPSQLLQEEKALVKILEESFSWLQV